MSERNLVSFHTRDLKITLPSPQRVVSSDIEDVEDLANNSRDSPFLPVLSRYCSDESLKSKELHNPFIEYSYGEGDSVVLKII